ncbi:MAG: hypothetical protein MPL62_05005 [Alphaproteobacteria bacterium]|nr:hypothetical protein [Alphaproteobacteria bacterium]
MDGESRSFKGFRACFGRTDRLFGQGRRGFRTAAGGRFGQGRREFRASARQRFGQGRRESVVRTDAGDRSDPSSARRAP